MSIVLVVNSGSSSLKYRLIDVESGRALASGLVERIGEPAGRAVHSVPAGPAASAAGSGPSAAGSDPSAAGSEWTLELAVPDHTAALGVMLDAFDEHGPSLERDAPVAVGHRVVHGGTRFFEPTIVTDAVKADIADLADLAPLHNPANLAGIEAAQAVFADVPHVAVFDTAFHQTLPPAAHTYAIDAVLAERHLVRRYGFHGTSHRYVAGRAAEFLGRPLEELAQLVLHLGNGASITAVDGGRSVETSMGLTPLEGLVMGTRSGDLDPAVLFHLHRRAGLSFDELDALLNKRSGLVGLAGSNDMRDVEARRDAGDADAALAFDVYVHRIKGYVGAYFAQLGRLDAISFTAGVGEHSPPVRAAALAGLERLGIEVDARRNETVSRGIRIISTDASAVTVLVVPTNEELEIARETLAAIGPAAG